MAFSGSDIEQLSELARAFALSATRLEDLRDRLGSQMNSVYWGGADADRMRDGWRLRDSVGLTDAVGLLRVTSEALLRQAGQQVDASTVTQLGTGISPAVTFSPVVRQSASTSGGWFLQLLNDTGELLSINDLPPLVGTFMGKSGVSPFVDLPKWFGWAGWVLPAVTLAETGREFGTGSGEFAESVVNTVGGYGASVAGAAFAYAGGGMSVASAALAPEAALAGAAFYVGWKAGEVITDNTQVDEVIADSALGWAFRDVPPEPPDVDMSTMSREEIAAYMDKVYAHQRAVAQVAEDMQNPIKAAVATVAGVIRLPF